MLRQATAWKLAAPMVGVGLVAMLAIGACGDDNGSCDYLFADVPTAADCGAGAHNPRSRGARRRAAVVGGSLAVCITVIAGFAALITLGLVHAPTIVMPGVFIVVVAMGYELGWDMIAAAHLAAQLRASEQRFRAVVEAVPSAILLVDDKGMITLANAQAEAVFGYRRAELLEKPVEMLIPERFRARHVDLRGGYGGDARAMGAGRELFACRKDGREIPVEAALSPMSTEEGAFVLVSVVDITERRGLEQATARQRDELAHLSRVAMLGELSGSLAHELNQPLTAILSNAQAAQRFLAQNPPRVDKLAEILADIVKSDHRAGAVIQRLRSMLRKEEAQHHPLELNDVVEESLRLMRSDLLNRHVSVSTDLGEALPDVHGDWNQLQQVLLNLVINACDAMDGRGADRRLLVQTRATANGCVEVSVADQGAGIPPADLERIFEPFVTTKSNGLGMGLPICRSIVEAHGGRLWASNNADRGATLHCELPVEGTDDDARNGANGVRRRRRSRSVEGDRAAARIRRTERCHVPVAPGSFSSASTATPRVALCSTSRCRD